MKRLVAALALLAFLVACGDQEPSAGQHPDGRQLLRKSAEVMEGVTSVHFTLNVEGPIGVFSIKDAEGDLTRDGNAQAVAHVNQGGRVVEYEYVQVAGQAYLKGPTGGFQPLPEAIAARFFDPTALLSGERSLSKGLAESTNARTEAEEEVEGVDAYRIRAKVDPNDVEGMALIATGAVDNAELYVGKDTHHLVQAILPFEAPGDEEPTVLTVTFSRFDENVEIQAPA